MCIQTVRDWAESELQHYRNAVEKSPDGVPGYYHAMIGQLTDDLAWYSTDEVRPCWTVTNLFEYPVIYTEPDGWKEWVEDLDEEAREFVTVVEGTITGREAGDLDYFNE